MCIYLYIQCIPMCMLIKIHTHTHTHGYIYTHPYTCEMNRTINYQKIAYPKLSLLNTIYCYT